MRYAQVETVSFKDALGDVYAIKEMRELPEYQTAAMVNRNAPESPDETVVRDDALGAGSEGNAYLLWEANGPEIVDAGFDWTRIKKVKVPVT